MTDLVTWYVIVTVIGAAGLPPALVVFGRLRSGGILYARPIALLIVAEIVWIVAALTPIPYGLPLILSAVAALAAWSLFLVLTRASLVAELMARWRILVAGELLFAGLYGLIVLVRAQAPNAWATEKPMEIMLLTTLRRANDIPPPDPWFGGESLSYYHLGHTIIDIVGRLGGIAPGVEFTLGIALAGALAGAAVFAVAGDLLALSPLRRAWSPWVAGTAAVLGLLFMATAVGFIDLLSAHDIGRSLWGHLGVDGVPGPVGTEDGAPTQFWWWWRATRVIPGTITEFPAFSFILGDVHPHVLALPFGTVAIALALPAVAEEAQRSWRYWLRRPTSLVIAAVLYSGLAMTNTWDALAFGLLWATITLAAFVRAAWRPDIAVFLTVRYMLPPVLLALLLALPFIATFSTPPPSVHLLTEGGSDPTRFLLVWLPLLLPLLVFWLVVRPQCTRRTFVYGAGAGLLPIVAWILVAQLSGNGEALSERGSGWFLIAGLSLSAGLVGSVGLSAYARGERALFVLLALVAVTALILLLTELVNLEDRAGGRYNTVFKFWYAGWLLLAIAGAVAVATAIDRIRGVRLDLFAAPVLIVAIVVSGGALLYGPAAAVSRAREGQQRGLDSLSYLTASDPGLAAAVEWAGANLGRDDILLEAVSTDYGPGNMLSAASGVPTLLGWPGATHETQWRGRIPEIPERQAAVTQIYTEGATDAVRQLASSYGVTYVYLGQEEQVQFGADVIQRFGDWETVFEAGGARIVAVPEEPDEAAR